MSPSAVTTPHNNKIMLDLRSSNPNPNPQAYREPPPPKKKKKHTHSHVDLLSFEMSLLEQISDYSLPFLPPPPFGLFFCFSIFVCGKKLTYPAHMVHALIQLKLFFFTKVYIKMHCCCVIFLCCIAFWPHTQICQSNYGLFFGNLLIYCSFHNKFFEFLSVFDFLLSFCVFVLFLYFLYLRQRPTVYFDNLALYNILSSDLRSCSDIQCQNGGVCNTLDLTCRCPDGYEGELCEIPVPPTGQLCFKKI